MSDDGFLSRWSRRKVEAKRGALPGETPGEPAVPAREDGAGPAVPTPSVQPASSVARESGPRTEGEARPPDPRPPTLDEATALTRGADISRFMAPKVGEDVKRVALKKLFADPHFNVMDGLDTYIDDYSKSTPIPPSVLRKMAQAQMLRLFDDDDERPAAPGPVPEAQAAAPQASPDGAVPAAVTTSVHDTPAVPPDEDPDLRLQQDHAARHGGADEGPAA
jgi:hypothetical protein